MLRTNDATFLRDVIGMPERHAQAFRNVAMSERCVIMCRATGPTCHGLLEAGYDTKGYRIHGKSCDWGPMAGFVMRDPRLNKYGMTKVKFNREKHHEALVADHENQGWKASTTPLVILESRRVWLVEKGLITVQKKGDRWDGRADHPTGISFKYSLIPAGDNLWGVYFDNTELGKAFVQERGATVVRYHRKYGSRYEPMLAMTNPPEHRQYPGDHYLNAITGDYDLFAVWPYVKDYNPLGEDYRPLGTTRGFTGPERENIDRLERDFTRSGQGTKLGNITNRIYMVCQLINSIVGRHVLWHSDEGARPFLDDVDLPVIAFTPAGNYMAIRNIPEFKTFIALCDFARIKVVLSNAWTADPTEKYRNRLGRAYADRVPADTVRTIVPDWYNR